MTLPENEYYEYMTLHMQLLHFAGKNAGVIPKSMDFEKFVPLDMDAKYHCRQALYADNTNFEKYVAANESEMDPEQKNIVIGFNRCITGEFIILKCLPSYAIFMDTKSTAIYAVKALGDPFNYLIKSFPASVTATLLPFRNKIIYDGVLTAHTETSFDRNTIISLNEQYAKAKKGNRVVMGI